MSRWWTLAGYMQFMYGLGLHDGVAMIVIMYCAHLIQRLCGNRSCQYLRWFSVIITLPYVPTSASSNSVDDGRGLASRCWVRGGHRLRNGPNPFQIRTSVGEDAAAIVGVGQICMATTTV